MIVRPALINTSRCWAPDEDLDGEGELRSREHREAILRSKMTLAQIWDKYGIVADVMVRAFTRLLDNRILMRT
jgi:hypothetical protein